MMDLGSVRPTGVSVEKVHSRKHTIVSESVHAFGAWYKTSGGMYVPLVNVQVLGKPARAMPVSPHA